MSWQTTGAKILCAAAVAGTIATQRRGLGEMVTSGATVGCFYVDFQAH